MTPPTGKPKPPAGTAVATNAFQPKAQKDGGKAPPPVKK